MATNHHILAGVFSAKDIQRFHSHVEQCDPDSCWPWKAGKGRQGYGHFKANRRTYKASRIAYFLRHAIDPCGYYVCHHCDNASCCNPDHLFLGTNQDNQIDAREKGKLHPLSGDKHFSRLHPELVARGDKSGWRTKPESYQNILGEKNYHAKLTEQDVREIRELYAEGYDTMKEIGAYYSVDAATVCDIVNRKKWKHVA